MNDRPRQITPSPLSRRSLLHILAAAPSFAAVPRMLRAEAAAAGLIAGDVCLVAPELTEGPFYVDPELVRAEIAEGRPGLPLHLRLQVVGADCSPITGARVDVWHCDAGGDYSGVENLGGGADTTGQTFLRGTLATGEDGTVSFRTIFPGWYRGRTPHIHYKVFLGDSRVLTSQLFFDDAASAQVYATSPHYVSRGNADTTNATDGIAQDAGQGALCTLTEGVEGLGAALVVGVDEDALGQGGLLRRIFG